MTGMPASVGGVAPPGRSPAVSCARMISASTPWAIRPSISASCLVDDDLRVGRDIGGTGGIERGLDRGFVGLPALFLEVRPADADFQVGAKGGRCRGQGRHGDRGEQKRLVHVLSSHGIAGSHFRHGALRRRHLRWNSTNCQFMSVAIFFAENLLALTALHAAPSRHGRGWPAGASPAPGRAAHRGRTAPSRHSRRIPPR